MARRPIHALPLPCGRRATLSAERRTDGSHCRRRCRRLGKHICRVAGEGAARRRRQASTPSQNLARVSDLADQPRQAHLARAGAYRLPCAARLGSLMAWRLRSAARRDSSSRATPRRDAREVERRSRPAEPVPQQGFRIVDCPSSPLSEAGVTDLSPASADGWSGIHDGIIARSMRWSDAASHEPLAALRNLLAQGALAEHRTGGGFRYSQHPQP